MVGKIHTMNTTFIINGGAGRVITAISALEKYARQNPKDDFKVLVYGWEMLFWSHPLLQNKTFSIGTKGIFNQTIKNSRTICPEPYLIHGYYNQQLSMAEAFDEEINKTTDHKDLTPPRLYVATQERNSIKKIIRDRKQEKNKSKVLVIQPYGSGMAVINDRPFDNSHRSLDVDDYVKIIKLIEEKNKDVLICFFGDKQFRHPDDDISDYFLPINTDLRFYMSLIEESDYFVGVDSVGQHMARALNTPGMIIMGSTDEKNVSYSDYFTIFRNGRIPEYSPIRLSGIDCEFADRMNDRIMTFSDDHIAKIVDIVNRNLYEQ